MRTARRFFGYMSTFPTLVFDPIMLADPISFAHRTTEYERVVTAEQVGAANLTLQSPYIVCAT